MSRRADPERLYQAHRAGHLSRLIAESPLSPEAPEEWFSPCLEGMGGHGPDEAATMGRRELPRPAHDALWPPWPT